MAELSRNARIRVQAALGLVVAAFGLEILALAIDPGPCVGGQPREFTDYLFPIIGIGVPILWLTSLVLSIWGRDRGVLGRVKAFALFVVAAFWLPAFTHFFEACY